MRDINELKDAINSKTLNLVLLAIATAGIYPIMWLYAKYKIFDKITGVKTGDDVYFIWIAVCAGISTALSSTDEVSLVVISGLLSIASAVLYILWAFRAKKALQEYALSIHQVDLRMNAVWTFIFTIFYINYCINDLPEAKRKQDIVRGAVPAA